MTLRWLLILGIYIMTLFCGALQAGFKPRKASEFEWESGGQKYWANIFVPKEFGEGKVPLLVTFHRSRDQIGTRWQKMAEEGMIIFVGPNSC